MERQELNALTIENELQWLQKVIDYRFNAYFGKPSEYTSIFEITAPDLLEDNSLYAQLIKEKVFNIQERLVIILTLTPHVRPQLLDPFFVKNSDFNRGFTEFGGIKGDNHGGFIPTGETAAFLYAGLDIKYRMDLMKVFDVVHAFNKEKILFLDQTKENEPFFSGALVLTIDYIDLLTLGETKKPTFSSKFPATLVKTKMNWDDLVLDRSSKSAVDHMLTWINKNQVIMDDWGMGNKIKPGYRALFYGPPGTGKTLTASLMGKATGKDVYKIDISMVSSKWVGETEKNLARIFDAAESKDWILFFDEADSIFGKRTSSGSSQEKHGNQEVSYLLQRTEEYPGIVILASNLKGNIDDAFIRRFQSMVYFKMPTAEERYNLWLKAFDGTLKLDNNIDLRQISKDYEIAGGAIVNVLKYCAVKALQQDTSSVLEKDLVQGIKNELMKEGKTG
ncbi:ATP-binding protein [Vicingaceae bacterium]|nr:ATP-binding protein [Vicingaceae bacterium]